jgi:hypothetical protein
LDSTVESVTSALKRARAGLARRQPDLSGHQAPPAPGSAAENAILARFVTAYEAADVGALVALLTDDVFISMPPMALEYVGRDEAAGFCANLFGSGRSFTLVSTRANGQPAFGAYVPGPDDIRHGAGLITLALADAQICAITRFESSVFASFGLPLLRPAQ